RVEQRWQYQINYVATERLTLLAPKILTSNGSLEFYWDGQKLAMPATRDATDPAASLFTLILPKPKLGRGELTAKFSLPMERLVPDATIPVTIPLFNPVEGELSSNELTVTTAPGMQAELRGETWSALTKGAGKAESQP